VSTVAATLQEAVTFLRPLSPSPDVDAEYLLLHVLQQDRMWLRLHGDARLAPAEADAFAALVARRGQGEPVAYLTGMRGFWTLDLAVDARVLIPRPETEMLVEFAQEKIAAGAAACVLDLGTGSGAVALGVKAERPCCTVTAVDASGAALAVARANAQRLGLPLECLESDWFSALAGRRFDLVLANPPYIAAGDPHAGRGDLRFEPRAALVSGDDGLHDIRRIAAAAPAHLLAGGWLALEHGAEQGAAVRAILAAAGFTAVATRCDLSGHERITLGQHHAG
jgi:release factor glutamine methyltransferase